jgi:antirestriction protein ArdC
MRADVYQKITDSDCSGIGARRQAAAPGLASWAQRRTHHAALACQRCAGANAVHGGSRAYYIPSTDNIHMPCIP